MNAMKVQKKIQFTKFLIKTFTRNFHRNLLSGLKKETFR
jgi:hypothetical protein